MLNEINVKIHFLKNIILTKIFQLQIKGRFREILSTLTND